MLLWLVCSPQGACWEGGREGGRKANLSHALCAYWDSLLFDRRACLLLLALLLAPYSTCLPSHPLCGDSS